MDSNIIAAIIGVGASILVFIATVIAGVITDKIKERDKIKKSHAEELCINTRKIINVISKVNFQNNNCMDNLNSYSKKEVFEGIDVQALQGYMYSYVLNLKELLDNYNIAIDYIDNHGITLSDFTKYSAKIKNISIRIFNNGDRFAQLNNYISQHLSDMFKDGNFEKLKSIHSEYNNILNELYFYYYNLNIELQNSIYSKYFKGKELEKLKNELYEDI